jgi:hypothetical protein
VAARVPSDVLVTVIADFDVMTEHERLAVDDPSTGNSDVKGKTTSPLELIEPGAYDRSDTRLDPRHPLSIQSAQFRAGEAVRSTIRTAELRAGRGGCHAGLDHRQSSCPHHTRDRPPHRPLQPPCTARRGAQLRGGSDSDRSRLCGVGRLVLAATRLEQSQERTPSRRPQASLLPSRRGAAQLCPLAWKRKSPKRLTAQPAHFC